MFLLTTIDTICKPVLLLLTLNQVACGMMFGHTWNSNLCSNKIIIFQFGLKQWLDTKRGNTIYFHLYFVRLVGALGDYLPSEFSTTCVKQRNTFLLFSFNLYLLQSFSWYHLRSSIKNSPKSQIFPEVRKQKVIKNCSKFCGKCRKNEFMLNK